MALFVILVSSVWQGRLRSSSSSTMAEMDSKAVVIDTDDLEVLVKLSVLEVFSEDTTQDKLKSCMSSLLQPFKDALVKANSEIDCPKADVADKGNYPEDVCGY